MYSHVKKKKKGTLHTYILNANGIFCQSRLQVQHSVFHEAVGAVVGVILELPVYKDVCAGREREKKKTFFRSDYYEECDASLVALRTNYHRQPVNHM